MHAQALKILGSQLTVHEKTNALPFATSEHIAGYVYITWCNEQDYNHAMNT